MGHTLNALTIAGAAALAISAGAQAQSFNRQAVISQFDQALVGQMVESLGHTVLEYRLNSRGNPTVDAQTDGGLYYTISGVACGDRNSIRVCNGANITTSFSGYGATLTAVNRLNVQYAAVQVYEQDSSVGVTKYMILDHGVTTANMVENIDIATQIAALVQESLAEQAY